MSGNSLLLAAAWIAGILLILAVALTIAMSDVVTGLQYLNQFTAVLIPLVIGFTAVAAVRFILGYLQTATPPTPLSATTPAASPAVVATSTFSDRLSAVEDRLKQGAHILEEFDQDKLIASLQQRIEHAATQKFIDGIRASIADDQAQQELLAVLKEWHARTIDKLLHESSTLASRGHLTRIIREDGDSEGDTGASAWYKRFVHKRLATTEAPA